MHVYGQFVLLPESEPRLLPVPWYCRAPLGLKKNTSVYVALAYGSRFPKHTDVLAIDQAPATWTTRLPDIIVTVMNPEYWNNSSVVRVSRPDGVGLIRDVLNDVRDAQINIVLGESVTKTSPRGRVHEVCLYCEHTHAQSKTKLHEWAASSNLDKSKGWQCDVADYLPPDDQLHVHPLPPGKMKGGCVVLDRAWRDLMDRRLQLFRLDHLTKRYDRSRAVITGDIESRAVRFVFPRTGAKRIESYHSDEPNVWADIVNVIAGNKYSILCEYLRKSSFRFSKLEAIVEPEGEGSQSLSDASFNSLQLKAEVLQVRVLDAIPYEECLFAKLTAKEISSQVALEPDKHAEVLLNLVNDWRLLKYKRPLTDELDHKVASELWTACCRVLKINNNIGTSPELLPREARGKLILYMTSGAPKNRDNWSDVDKLVRGVVGLHGDSILLGRGRQQSQWYIADGDELDSEQRHACLVHSNAAIFVAPRYAPELARRTPCMGIIAEAALCKLWNLECNRLFLIDDAETPASWKFDDDRTSSIFGEIRRYQWTDRPSEFIASRAGLEELLQTETPARVIDRWLKSI